MKSFYEFYKILKESVGSEKDFSDAVDAFLEEYKDTNRSDEDRLLPMLIAADIMDSFYENHAKAEFMREYVEFKDYLSLLNASENYKKHKFFTFNRKYAPNIVPRVVVFSNRYPLKNIVREDETGGDVRIHAIASVTDEVKQSAIKSQMSVEMYFRSKIEDFEPISHFLNLSSSELEFFPVRQPRPGSNAVGFASIVSPNGELRQGPYDHLNDELSEKFLNQGVQELFGENLTSGKFFIVNDLEELNA